MANLRDPGEDSWGERKPKGDSYPLCQHFLHTLCLSLPIGLHGGKASFASLAAVLTCALDCPASECEQSFMVSVITSVLTLVSDLPWGRQSYELWKKRDGQGVGKTFFTICALHPAPPTPPEQACFP